MNSRTALLAAAPLLAITASGCADRLAARSAELSHYVGRDETQVVQALGVPSRSYETGGVKYIAYERQRIDYDPGVGPARFSRFGFAGPLFGPGIPPSIYHERCETTFQLRGGVVQSFDFRGNDCGSLAPLAARIVPIPTIPAPAQG